MDIYYVTHSMTRITQTQKQRRKSSNNTTWWRHRTTSSYLMTCISRALCRTSLQELNTLVGWANLMEIA